MRTKTLLMTAALGAAGILAAKAQVYSVNAVGYINLDLKAGFSLIANQLNNGDNTLNTVLTGAPNGTTVYKYNGTSYDISTFLFGTWSPNLTLKPGEGAFINLAAAAKFTLVGEVPQGTAAAPLTQQVPAGFSIQSSQVPQSANLEGATGLNFPGGNGDTVYFFRNGAYVISTFLFGAFSPAAVPAVGESFFVNKGAAGTWTRVFSVN